MNTQPGTSQWLQKPRNRKRLWWGFLVLLVLAVAAELAVHLHPHFGIDSLFGFHAWFSFGACAAMIAVAKFVGLLLERPESYAGRRDE